MFGIVIVNYGAPTLLSANAARWHFTAAEAVVVVVDNFSSQANREAVHQLAGEHRWQVVDAANDGFGPGCNVGAQAAIAAGAEQILFVNPDVWMASEVAVALATHVAENPRVVVSPVTTDPAGKINFRGGATSLATGETVKRGTPDSFDWLTGAALALSASAFTELGGFADDYFMYWEDLDFSYRATQSGLQLTVREDLSVIHDVGGTQDHVGKSPLYIHYNCRNRLLFAARHLTAAQRTAWRRTAWQYAYNVILRSGSKKYLLHPPSVKAAVQGTRAGLALLR